MHVVFRDVSAENLYAVGFADFPYQISHAYPHPSNEYGFAVLGCPDQVVFEVEDGVGRFAIQLHAF